MRHLITTLAVLAASSGTGHAQTAPAIVWQHNYGGSMSDGGHDISRTSDGGYVVAGTTQSSDGDVTGHHGLRDLWLIKLQANGTMEWQRSYGGSDWEEVRSLVRETADGGFILGGTTSSTDGDVECAVPVGVKAWVVKTDGLGTIQWQRCLGGSGVEHLSSIAVVDGGYVMCGGTYSSDGDAVGNHGLMDAWVVKLDTEGNTLWGRCYGGSHNEVARSVTGTSDGGCVVAGYTQSGDGDLSSVNPYHILPVPSRTGWIFKLDGDGDIQWQKCYGGWGNDFLHAVAEAPNGTYWATGYTHSVDGDIEGNHGGADAWVLRIDASGDLVQQRCLGGEAGDRFNGLHILPNGSVLLVGYTSSSDGDITEQMGLVDAWTVLLTPSMEIQWQRSMGGSAIDHGYAMDSGHDGGAIMVGYSVSADGDLTGNHGETDLWVVKLAPWDDTGLHDAAANGALPAYPNPAADVLHVDLGRLHGPGWAVQVFDPLGRVVHQQPAVHGSQGRLTIPIAQLARGTYCLRLGRGAEYHTARFIKH
jgi:hypothetical protein